MHSRLILLGDVNTEPRRRKLEAEARSDGWHAIAQPDQCGARPGKMCLQVE